MTSLPFQVRPLGAVLACGLVLAGCAGPSRMPEIATSGARPTLPAPDEKIVPTVKVAKAVGWADGATPTAAAGLTVNAFATGLDHPRWIHVLRNGDVLVAETNAPERPEHAKGIRGKAMKMFMERAGSVTPSANRLTLLRDADGDGRAEVRTVFLQNLNSPFGMALVGDDLYVAHADAVWKYPYRRDDLTIAGAGTKVADLPAGPRNQHWTRNIIASKDGNRLYAAVGSASNIGEHGLHEEEGRAAIHEIDLGSGRTRLFATGLRNPVGLAWEPRTGALWTAVNERDELGNDLVPDYMTSVKDGGFYGWPWSYFGSHVDARVEPARPDLVSTALAPDYALGAHTASLGLAFYEAELLPSHYRGGAFVGQHGSWNRNPPSGYKVVFVPFTDGRPAGQPEDVLTGFLNAEGEAQGRPVGVAVDRRGALLVADDVGNVIWRVAPAEAPR
jgi:glucose/arabinose dehydrogenase